MNIAAENIDALNAVVTITLNPEDYQPSLESSIKKVQRTASMPGFRPGKVPSGMIKKMYGKSILADELNRLLSDTLHNYIEENKLQVLGNPLPKNNGEEAGDFENPSTFEFHYELGLAPAFDINLDSKHAYDYIQVDVNDDMLAKYIDDLRRRQGKFSNPDVSSDADILYGQFVELNADGEAKEGGISTTTTLAIEFVKNDKDKFIGVKKDESIVFNPKKTIENTGEISSMLHISKEQAEALDSDFRFTIQTVNHIDKAELDQELFDKLYGAGTINSLEEFRNRIKTEVSAMFAPESDRMLKTAMTDHILGELALQLPDTFLKKWLMTVNEKPISNEELERDYPVYAKQLQWQLVTNKVLMESPEITITREELDQHSRQMIRGQFTRYGIHNIDEEKLDSYSQQMMKDEKEVKRMSNELLEVKVFQHMKSKVTLNPKPMAYADFVSMINAQMSQVS
jgi:trigger factor